MSTTSARVRCPHCGKSFKIPDRSLLGRTGKCSACAQKFTLAEDTGTPAASDAPSTRKATPAAPAPMPTPPEKPIPSSAAPKPAAAAGKPPATPSAKPAAPRAELSPSEKKSPSSAPTKPAAEPALAKPARVAAEDPPFGLNAKWVPDGASTTVVAPAAVAVDSSNPFGAPDENLEAPRAPRGRTAAAVATREEEPARPRRKKRRGPLIAAAAAVVLAAGGLAAVALTRGGAAGATGATGTSVAANTNPVPVGPTAYTRDMLKGNLALLEEFRPTHGRPISMQYVPNGVNLVVHLRPSELWSNDHAAAELRGSLTEGVTTWLDAKIKELCHRDPARISEVTFAFVLGAFGTQPASTQIVRLAEPDKMSSLIEEFQGKPLKEDLKPQITVAPPNAYVLVDTSTFSISPADTAEELEESLVTANGYVSKNVTELLKQTDRDRLLTVVAEMQDFRRHVDTLFVESARPTVHAIVDWLGEDVDAIAWSLHRGQTLHSEIVLRPKPGVTARALETALHQKLESLPEAVMKSVKGTRPAAKGFREIIGRYPAMLEAVVQSTILQPGGRDVHAYTVLPAKAAPNLALGTLLTWDELRRTPQATAGSVASASAGNEKVADRLKKEVLAEFSRMPLEQVVKYIGDETGVDFSVDGEALKMTGYTRNMPQTMSLGKVPATKALKAMLDVPNQKDLALFVDEASGKAVMSTRPYLKQQGKAEFKID